MEVRVFDEFKSQIPDSDPDETREWIDSLESVISAKGTERARFLLRSIIQHAHKNNVGLPSLIQTPYINTIPPENHPEYPGNELLEKRIRRIIRWNAMAMVNRANKHFPGIGG